MALGVFLVVGRQNSDAIGIYLKLGFWSAPV